MTQSTLPRERRQPSSASAQAPQARSAPMLLPLADLSARIDSLGFQMSTPQRYAMNSGLE